MKLKSKHGFDLDEVILRKKIEHSAPYESVISVSGLCSKFAEGEEDYNLEIFKTKLGMSGVELSDVVHGSKKTKTMDYIRLNKSNLDRLEKVIRPEYVKDIVFGAYHYDKLSKKMKDLKFVGTKLNNVPTFGLEIKELFKVAIHGSPLFFDIQNDVKYLCDKCDSRGDDMYFSNPESKELCLTLPGIRHYLTNSKEFDNVNLEEIMERASVMKHEYFKSAR